MGTGLRAGLGFSVNGVPHASRRLIFHWELLLVEQLLQPKLNIMLCITGQATGEISGPKAEVATNPLKTYSSLLLHILIQLFNCSSNKHVVVL